MTVTPRLKAGIFVRALIRRAEVAGAYATIAKKGLEESGAVVLQVNGARDARILTQARDSNGDLVWISPLGEAPGAEKIRAWLDKQVKYDPDLWIVEIDDREGRAFVDEPIV